MRSLTCSLSEIPTSCPTIEAEEIRIKELKETCAKKGLDFDTENQKYLDKKAKKDAKKAAKRAK